MHRGVGVNAREFVPARRIDGFDQIYCRSGRRRQRLVEANDTFRPGQLPRRRGRAVHVLDRRRGSSSAVAVASPTLAAQAKRCGLTVRSFVSLR